MDRFWTALFSDALDSLGYPNQVVSGFTMNDSSLFCMGEAHTLKVEAHNGYAPRKPDDLHLGLSYLCGLPVGSVLCVQGSSFFAYFGSLMYRLAQRTLLSGIVIDGLTRDSSLLSDSPPVFARGYTPRDIGGRGRIVSAGEPIEMDGIKINVGDLIVGDSDGVVVVPQSLKSKVIGFVLKEKESEKDIMERIDKGEGVLAILKHHAF